MISRLQQLIEQMKKNKIKKDIMMLLEKGVLSDNAIHSFLKDHNLTYFNYSWFNEYDSTNEYTVCRDDEECPYIIFKGHKMYFKKTWSEKRIYEYLDSLIPEQDYRSPHLYFAEGEKKEKYGTVVDAGAAEGFFALELVDIAEHILLVECDEEWIEALEKTFAPYKDKVTIVKKYLGDKDSDKMCTLDSIVANYTKVDLIKLDIEGSELDALVGGVNVALRQADQLLICVYHYQNEENDIRDWFDHYNRKSKITARDGFIYFMHDKNQKFPYLRHGILRVELQ